MRNILRYILILGVGALVSCNQNNEIGEVKEIYIKMNSLELPSSNSPFSNIELIKIKSNGEYYLSSFTKIISHNEHLYILDSKSMTGSKIFKVDWDGNVVNVLDKKGKGPGEYIKIADFDIDKNSSQICALDNVGKKIMFYDQNFKYTGYLISPNSEFRFTLINYNETTNSFLLRKGNPAFLPDFNYEIIEINTSGVITGKFVPYSNTSTTSFGGRQRLWESNSSFYYLPGYSNSIYQIQNDTTVESYRFNFDEPTLTYKEYKATRMTDYAIVNQSFISSDDFLVFQWGYNGDFFFSVNDIKTGKSTSYRNPKDPTCNCGMSLSLINFISPKEVVLKSNSNNLRHILSVISPKMDNIQNLEILNKLSTKPESIDQILIVADIGL